MTHESSPVDLRLQHRRQFEIDRRENLSYEEFVSEYLYPLKPVIISRALDQWPALQRWTPEFFQQEFETVKFSIGSTEYGQSGPGAQSQALEYTMGKFIDMVLESTEAKPAPYFRNQIIRDLFPSLLKDLEPMPEYVQPNWLGDRFLVGRVAKILNRGAEVELYIGGTGARFPILHYDGVGTHAFLMQIYGRKEYITYPPHQEPYLYASPDKPNLSLINDVENPDETRFPRFRNAQAVRFFLEPGELLFVPSHWWHTAKILSPSITVSVNVLNQSNWRELRRYITRKQRNPAMVLACRLYLAGAGAFRFWRDRDWRARANLSA